MAAKQISNDYEQHQDTNFADMQTSFSINEIGSKIEKEAREYFGTFQITPSVTTFNRRDKF